MVRIIKIHIGPILMFLLFRPLCPARDMVALYKQADEYAGKYTWKLRNSPIDFQAIDNTQCYWYSVNTAQGQEFVLLDATRKSKQPAFDHVRLATALSAELNRTVDPWWLPFPSIQFDEKLESFTFTVDEKEYT